ncbi:DUF6678 family protein [Phyllobacterium ifriqiyense]|uniref:DUF6678 family protein n=1 Tax=Phyllobacterium ifriqiyense TaxID=314238 RepID=UPI003522754D
MKLFPISPLLFKFSKWKKRWTKNFARKFRREIQRRGLTSYMNDTKWMELQTAIENELPILSALRSQGFSWPGTKP